MQRFTKQLIFILTAVAIIASGALIIYSATPQGKLKIKPSLTAKLKVVNQENATSTSNNPVGWWKMDEGTGQYAYDVSGNGNTGTLGTSTSADGADPTWTTGKLGKGLSFDGVDDYVSVGTFTKPSSFTISLWVNFSSYTQNGYAGMVFLGDGNNLWGLTANDASSGKITLSVSNGVAPQRWKIETLNSTNYPVGWHHLVGIGNGSTLSYYKDGVFSTSTSQTIANSGTDILSIGRWGTYANGASYFSGLIDDVRIYNRALSASEVAQMYNSTKDGYLGKIKVSTGLVGYWKLDDNQSLTSVIDYSGKGNTGTAYSGTATSTATLSTSTAMIGRAMSFDGVDDYVNAGSGASLQITGSLTISAWIKPTTVVNSAIAGKYKANTGERAYQIEINTNKFRMPISSNGTAVAYRDSNQSIQAGVWQHVVGVYNNSLQTITLYINGVNDIGTLTGTVPASINNTSIYFGVGANAINSTPANYFNGVIDEVKIWNYARSAEQIGQDYIRGLKGLP